MRAILAVLAVALAAGCGPTRWQAPIEDRRPAARAPGKAPATVPTAGTAAAPRQVPEALRSQLAAGGRMVLPLESGGVQQMVLIERSGRGFLESVLDAVRFVPMEAGKA